MADNARGIHVSPGVYSREIDMTYAVKSLGITTLGVVGETLRGPAFQPTHIENWREYTATFGGTSTEKFKGSKYPKYELPYIAKSYLTESKQMEVVRVLGLSGYNAGPAWLITAKLKSGEDMVVAVLRSRGTYYKYRKFSETTGSCECPNDIYDSLVYEVGEVKVSADTCNQPVAYNGCLLGLGKYTPLYSSGNDCVGYHFDGENEDFDVNAINMGRFKITGYTGTHEWFTKDPTDEEKKSMKDDYFEYAVSLNANDSDYILNVLGMTPNDGDTPIYVESLYDVALGQCIMNTGNTQAESINPYLTFYQVYYPADYDNLQPVNGIIRLPENNLSSKNLGQRFLADKEAANSNGKNDPVITCHPYDYQTGLPIGFTMEEVSHGGYYRKLDWITGLTDEERNVNIKITDVTSGIAPSGTENWDTYSGTSAYTDATKYTLITKNVTATKIVEGETVTVSGIAYAVFKLGYPNLNVTMAQLESTSANITYNDHQAFFNAVNNYSPLSDRTEYYYTGMKGNEQADEYTETGYTLQNFKCEWKHNATGDTATAKKHSVTIRKTYDGAEFTDTLTSSKYYPDRVTRTLKISGNTVNDKIEITEIKYNTNSYIYDDTCKQLPQITGTTNIQRAIEYNKDVLRTSFFGEYQETVKPGQIYTVVQYTDTSGKRRYYYRYYLPCSLPDHGNLYSENADNVVLMDRLFYGKTYTDTGSTNIYNRPSNSAETRAVIVKNFEDGLYYRLSASTASTASTALSVSNDITYVCCDLNDYKSAYRYASTPWIVSNLKGDFKKIELNKLFRFHTISDGDSSNNEIKISIEDIKPDDGCFDVVVRKINDTDQSPVILEKFSRCTLQPGSAKYLGLQIGTYDGMYESQSRYITVEINENSMVEASVPAGFLGYPQVQFDGAPIVDDAKSNIIGPIIKYNLDYDPNIKNRKQYFGLSNLTGVDIDLFTFKGNAAYIEQPDMLTNGFHLDSRLNKSGYPNEQLPTITVDGVEGYKFDAVSQNARTSILTDTPVIGTEAMMQGTIYENVKLRKFTMYFYGGFDGWDVYRQQRSNTDDFKLAKYNGSYNKESGEGYAFNRIEDPELLGLNQNGITSDWYAYLSAYRQFANPESVDVNVFATPGIDYVNNKLLAEEVISMLEEERADSIYVVTTPDKPNGAEDYVSEIFTPQDAVDNLEDTEIDSNYTCTYYPWVKYYDVDNNQYIYLPPTKDVVRNFAQTDNTAYPWFAPAGLDRGNVNCVKARFVTRLSDEDTLYEGRINPIKTFAGDNGVKVWGQKNMQIEDTQLNRIAVRRLLLRMRKLIAIACRSLIFEQNDNVVRNQFLSIVTPIMDNIRSNRGISDYKIEVAESIDEKDCKELNAKIFFKPYCALEYISLDFILTPQGVDFENI